MKCPVCATLDTKVIDSRMNQTGDLTRRRRECPKCEARFTTYERVEEVMPVVIKKDGRREPFSREKILDGLKKACQKRSVATQKLDETLSRIERKIQSLGLKEIPSKTVGHKVMVELHELDKVAYIRFASVYREFRDVEEFVAELHAPAPHPEIPGVGSGNLQTSPSQAQNALGTSPDATSSRNFRE
ncbi:MAG: transcriptional repressor NrdR [Bdellovibrio sp.]|nr:transcriptional repressor NrdR [Bdellovibrio sp.]